MLPIASNETPPAAPSDEELFRLVISEVGAERRPPYALESASVLTSAKVDSESGLNEIQVRDRQAQFGPNELSEPPPEPTWRRLLGQFKDLVIWILVFAAVISGILGEWVDSLAIIAIVMLNAAIGFFQEERAENALAALRKLSAPLAKVLRAGVTVSVPSRELVPGDIVQIEAGDNIPADARLFQAFNLTMQEASLTGESVAVEKDALAVLDAAAPLGDRRNMVYMGTIAASGKARAVIVAIGMQTELGSIAGLLRRYEPEPTPLQRRLAELGRILIVLCLIIVTVIFLLQSLHGGTLADAFLMSVSLAVAAVPEGLPAVVTIALALGLQRMVKRNALVRKLPSVETLGSVTVICSDKTGTLTRNEMTVTELLVGPTRYRVSGTGYVPRGEFIPITNSHEFVPSASQALTSQADTQLQLALSIGTWCNNASLVPRAGAVDSWQIIGDPTEGALIVAAKKLNIEAPRSRNVIYELPFDSDRKLMSVAVRDVKSARLYVKGAPEAVIDRCDWELDCGVRREFSKHRRNELLMANTDMARRALRVLALAYRDHPPDPKNEEPETGLTFVGLIGMIDPPREEAKVAVSTCRQAGIRPVMITGDHPATALAVAKELGMAADGDLAITGADLQNLNDDELARSVDRIPVYARASAEHKLRIIRAWKSRGQVVAMTGDGVNDAPAIKAADIGIAMGITGTDVTKEASDMVLTDDNFASIVSAVEEGRGIFDNIQKVLQFLLSCNFGELLLMFIATLLGWPAPLLPVQLLWINLVTDGLPALALSLEPPEPGVMRRMPRKPNESILSVRVGLAILLQGILVGGVGLAAFAISYLSHPGDVDRARAMTFCVMVYAELLRALAARSQTLTLWQLGFWTNPQLLMAVLISGLLQVSIAVFPFARGIFDVPAHFYLEWAIIATLALMPITLIEFGKIVIAQMRHRIIK